MFNGQWRVDEAERLGYDPVLISSHCTKGLLNFHTESALLHNTQGQGIHTFMLLYCGVYSLRSSFRYEHGE